MPAYYDVTFAATTNSAVNTQSTQTHIRLLTGTGLNAFIKGGYAAARSGTAGGGQLRCITAATAMSSQGTGATPTKRNPNTAAATSSAATATTCQGATTIVRWSVGFAQTGGMGGWVAIEPDASVQLNAAGGANGNAEFSTLANGASIPVDLTVEFSEA
jgi:hypothetical protein